MCWVLFDISMYWFLQRLETKGKYDISFFGFIQNIEEFKQKKFIQTMLTYYKDVKNKNNTKNNPPKLKTKHTGDTKKNQKPQKKNAKRLRRLRRRPPGAAQLFALFFLGFCFFWCLCFVFFGGGIFVLFLFFSGTHPVSMSPAGGCPSINYNNNDYHYYPFIDNFFVC